MNAREVVLVLGVGRARSVKKERSGDQKTARGFAGDPVPPFTMSGATTSMNS